MYLRNYIFVVLYYKLLKQFIIIISPPAEMLKLNEQIFDKSIDICNKMLYSFIIDEQMFAECANILLKCNNKEKKT